MPYIQNPAVTTTQTAQTTGIRAEPPVPLHDVGETLQITVKSSEFAAADLNSLSESGSGLCFC